jgi:hypothetical protein
MNVRPVEPRLYLSTGVTVNLISPAVRVVVTNFHSFQNLVVNDHPAACYLPRFGRLGMETKERSVDYAGHRIRVVAKSEGARLYVDNELLDVTNDLYGSEDQATLVGVFGEGDKFQIEVFVKPPTLQAAIRVNEQWAVGDQLHAVA